MTQTRLPAGERREQIALEALRLLGEGGRKSLTTANLAEAVSVTTGAIFRHYPSLEDVLEAAVNIAVARVEGTFPGAGADPLDRLVDLARNRVRVLGGAPGIAWMLRSEQASLQLPGKSVRELRALVARSREFVLDSLREGMAAGRVRDDVGAEELLVVYMGTIHTLIGVAGVHGRARTGRAAQVDRTLDALRVLLSPPGVSGGARSAGGAGGAGHAGDSGK